MTSDSRPLAIRDWILRYVRFRIASRKVDRGELWDIDGEEIFL